MRNRQVQVSISPYLIAQMERAGKKVIKKTIKGHVVSAKTENLLQFLKDTGFLTLQEYYVGIDYQSDFELSNRTNHAHMNWGGGSIADVNYDNEKSAIDDWMQASNRVRAVKREIEKEDQKFMNYQKYIVIKKLGRPALGKRLGEILKYAFEQSKSMKCAEEITGINQGDVKDKVKEICQIILSLKKESKKPLTN